MFWNSSWHHTCDAIHFPYLKNHICDVTRNFLVSRVKTDEACELHLHVICPQNNGEMLFLKVLEDGIHKLPAQASNSTVFMWYSMTRWLTKCFISSLIIPLCNYLAMTWRCTFHAQLPIFSTKKKTGLIINSSFIRLIRDLMVAISLSNPMSQNTGSDHNDWDLLVKVNRWGTGSSALRRGPRC